MPLAAFPKCFLPALCVSKRMTVDQWIDLASKLEVDGLEFYWGFTPWSDARELKRLRAKVEDLGMTIPMLCYSPDFTQPDAKLRRREIEGQKIAIQTAAVLGARCCRVLTGQRRADVTREQGLAWVRESLLELIPVAAANGIILTLENHYKDAFWTNPEFAQKTDVFLEVVDSINFSQWFGVNFDPSNALIAGEDPIALLQAVKHRVVSMHASDRYFEGGNAEDLKRLEADAKTGYASILKHGIIGRGLNDYDKIFSILRQEGFHGWISIEDGDDEASGMEHLTLSAQFLREKMSAHGLT
jgi:sugar phosphate isomerase/epimerase